MARVLIQHLDKSARKVLEQHAAHRHEVLSCADARKAIKFIERERPQAIIAGLDDKRHEALELLKQLHHRAGRKIPTIVVAAPPEGTFEPLAMKLGACAFLEYPVEREQLEQAISKAVTAEWNAKGAQPPITPEEAAANLTELEDHLNQHMQCFAGKNQVYLQSFLRGGGKTTRPRIALKCPLRQEYGEPPNVYYEYIRDVCCGDPTACTAFQTFKARHSA